MRRNHNYNYKRVNYIPRNINQKTLKSIKNSRTVVHEKMFVDLIEKIMLQGRYVERNAKSLQIQVIYIVKMTTCISKDYGRNVLWLIVSKLTLTNTRLKALLYLIPKAENITNLPFENSS